MNRFHPCNDCLIKVVCKETCKDYSKYNLIISIIIMTLDIILSICCVCFLFLLVAIDTLCSLGIFMIFYFISICVCGYFSHHNNAENDLDDGGTLIIVAMLAPFVAIFMSTKSLRTKLTKLYSEKGLK